MRESLAARLFVKTQVIIFAGVFMISILVWGFWPAQILRAGLVPDELRNASFFPYSLPLAPILIFFGIRKKSDALLCWATLCVSPFFQMHSMLPAIACTIHETKDWRIWALLSILSWLMYAGHVGWVIWWISVSSERILWGSPLKRALNSLDRTQPVL